VTKEGQLDILVVHQSLPWGGGEKQATERPDMKDVWGRGKVGKFKGFAMKKKRKLE